ncbi:hypothetical protein TNCV_554511 [Trichonephila clavipes]|nr:hypothetical protein TNCV_554511 [Trichonephila clavipes]
MFSRPHFCRLLVVGLFEIPCVPLSPLTLVELKNSTCREVFAVRSEKLNSAVTAVASRLKCSGDHVEPSLLQE